MITSSVQNILFDFLCWFFIVFVATWIILFTLRPSVIFQNCEEDDKEYRLLFVTFTLSLFIVILGFTIFEIFYLI